MQFCPIAPLLQGHSDFARKAKTNEAEQVVCRVRRSRYARATRAALLSGIEPSERAEILGHSMETNLRHYTFAKPDYLQRVKEALG